MVGFYFLYNVFLRIILRRLLNSLAHHRLHCYQCDSSEDEYCPESWDRTDILPKPCDQIDYPAFCVKTTGIYGAIVGTRRFCSSRNMDNSCNEVNFAQDPRIYYSCIYTCSSDGCNNSHRVYKVNFENKFLILIMTFFLNLFVFFVNL